MVVKMSFRQVWCSGTYEELFDCISAHFRRDQTDEETDVWPCEEITQRVQIVPAGCLLRYFTFCVHVVSKHLAVSSELSL